jgi:ATP phosphoribosyltransferase
MGISSLEDLKERKIRIATEYPWLAESLALRLRLREFTVYPLWGSALVYPPENSEVVLTSVSKSTNHLFCLSSLIQAEAVLIANKKSWQEKDLSSFTSLISPLAEEVPGLVSQAPSTNVGEELPSGSIRLALPDGHQGEPTFELLDKVGIRKERELKGSFYFSLSFPGLWAKVIRPQDMPLQVAQGNFDLAVTGEDWFWEHKLQFPSSPARKLLSFPIGRVNICAIVSQEVTADSPDLLRRTFAHFRVVSEYVNIADWYTRRNHLSPYRIIPTFGASESFLPEDGDLLIENVQTGATIHKQNLKVIDTLLSSSACLIASEESLNMDGKRISHLVDVLRTALG